MSIHTVFLPLCLAVMMLVVGSSLDARSFRPLLGQPRLALIGLGSQLLLLPLLVWLLILVFKPAPALATGLILIAAAPGGATSNLFSYLARGDVALSVALTAVCSLLAPLWMPWAVQVQLGWLELPAELQLSWQQSALQLLLVTALPLLLGMLWRHWWRQWVINHERRLKKLAAVVLLLMIITLSWSNRQHLHEGFNTQAAMLVILLASLALFAGYRLALALRLEPAAARTLSFETGVKNAGIAMLLAFSQLQQPAAGLTALLYGLLMNIPALLTLWAFQRSKRQPQGAAAISAAGAPSSSRAQ